MNEEDVGKFFTTDGKDIWRMVSYCAYPTATMENLQTKERVDGAVGCLNLKPFIKFILEKEIKNEQSNREIKRGN